MKERGMLTAVNSNSVCYRADLEDSSCGGNDKRRYVDSRDRNRVLIVSPNCSTEILAGSGSTAAPGRLGFC